MGGTVRHRVVRGEASASEWITRTSALSYEEVVSYGHRFRIGRDLDRLRKKLLGTCRFREPGRAFFRVPPCATDAGTARLGPPSATFPVAMDQPTREPS